MARPASDTLRAHMTDQPVLELLLGDIVRLRRPHPCGGTDWQVDRLGADIGLTCATCGRHAMIERRPLERRIEGFVRRGDRSISAVTAPVAQPDSAGAVQAVPGRTTRTRSATAPGSTP